MAHTEGFFSRKRTSARHAELEAFVNKTHVVKVAPSTHEMMAYLRARKSELAAQIKVLQMEHDAITV
jgi:hypothetical protein